MLHLIPASLHRAGLRLAYRVRRQFRRFFKPGLAGVGVILHDDEGRVLLVRHSYGPQAWSMPGGGLGRDEDPAEAVRREMREELGCELERLELLRSFDETISGTRHTGYIFGARPISQPQVDGREVVEARWFTEEDLPGLDLTRITKARLRELATLKQR